MPQDARHGQGKAASQTASAVQWPWQCQKQALQRCLTDYRHDSKALTMLTMQAVLRQQQRRRISQAWHCWTICRRLQKMKVCLVGLEDNTTASTLAASAKFLDMYLEFSSPPTSFPVHQQCQSARLTLSFSNLIKQGLARLCSHLLTSLYHSGPEKLSTVTVLKYSRLRPEGPGAARRLHASTATTGLMRQVPCHR